MEEFVACFAEVVDPRRDNARHDLHELLMIALCTLLSGGEDGSGMALFGEIIDPALIILIMRRSGTADVGRWRGSAAAAWPGCAYVGPQLASAVPCCAPAPCAGAPASSPRSRLHPD